MHCYKQHDDKASSHNKEAASSCYLKETLPISHDDGLKTIIFAPFQNYNGCREQVVLSDG
jgi:hypothetical protein